MGRHVGRSRGCQTCIKRRVKCDEEKPACYQCISAGWNCPGPVEGTIFIDMSEHIRQKRTRTISRRPEKNCLEMKNHPSSLNLTERSDSANEVVEEGLKLPNSYQPNRQDIFQDLYIATFISAQDATVHPWIAELPKLASSTSGQPDVYGIRAATLAFYAKLTRNRDLEIESAKWYSKGLDAQQEWLPLAAKTNSYQPCCYRAAGAAMMFSYFETVICILPTGWMQHYAAAIKMFEIAGPEQCQTGLIHMFFRSIRVAAFTTSLISDQPSVLASDLWCTVPFLQQPKTPFDHLIDILLQLPSSLPCRNKMRNLRDVNPTKSEILRRYLGTNAKHLLRRLDEFWQEHGNAIDSGYGQRMLTISSYHMTSGTRSLCPHPFRSSSDAYFTSMFDSGKAITLGFMEAASLVPNSYKQAIIIHFASILVAAAYCEGQGLFNGVSFSMVFPIKLVCLLSPSEEQRALAQSMLLKWGSKRGLEDICKVAAPTYLDRSHG